MKNGNWVISKLGDVSKINYGYTEKASFKEVGPKFLRITDIQDNNVNWGTVPFCKIEKSESPKYLLKEGDIVFARTGATTGKSFLIKNPPLAVFASYLIRLQILDLSKLSPEFLILFFQTKTYWDNIEIGISGSTQGGFNASKLAELQIPIPPLPEQQRIVSVLDEAFTSITQAKANAKRNLVNAHELFESVLEDVFVNPNKKWKRTTIGNEVELFTGFPFKSKGYAESADGIRLLRGDNIIQGALRWDNVKKWKVSEYSEYITYSLKEGDLVLAMDRPWVKAGLKYSMISKSDLPSLLVQRTACLRSGKNLENPFLIDKIVRSRTIEEWQSENSH